MNSGVFDMWRRNILLGRFFEMGLAGKVNHAAVVERDAVPADLAGDLGTLL